MNGSDGGVVFGGEIGPGLFGQALELPEFVPDPLVPQVHGDSLVYDFTIVWLYIVIEQILTVLLDLHRLGRLLTPTITSTKCAK